MDDVSIIIGAVDKSAAVIDKVNAGLGKLGATSSQTAQQAGKLSQVSGGLKTVLGGLGIGFLSASGAALALVATFKKVIAAAAEAEKIDVRLRGTLLSTGRVAQISAEQIDKMADSLSRLTGIDDENIKAAYNAIAKFGEIDTANMEEIVTVAADMAAALGGDLASNADSIARLLESRLIPRSWGFSKALKENILQLLDAGKSGEALDLVLAELNRRFGGQAVAQLNTYTGATEALNTSMGNLAETIGDRVIPAMTIFKLLAADSIDALIDFIIEGGGTADAYKKIAAAAQGLSDVDLSQLINENKELLKASTTHIEAALYAQRLQALQTEQAKRAGVVIKFEGDQLKYMSQQARQAGFDLDNLQISQKKLEITAYDYSGVLSFVVDETARAAEYEQKYTEYMAERSKLLSQKYSEEGRTIRELDKNWSDYAANYEQASKSIIFNMMAVKFAQDGITDDKEFAALMAMGEAWGLVSPDVAETATKWWEASDALTDTNIEANKAYGILTNILGLPPDKAFTITIELTGIDPELLELILVGGGVVGGGSATDRRAGRGRRASGGFIDPRQITQVGERGFEYIVPTSGGMYVIPHEQSVRMEQAGILAGRGYQTGGYPVEPGWPTEITPWSPTLTTAPTATTASRRRRRRRAGGEPGGVMAEMESEAILLAMAVANTAAQASAATALSGEEAVAVLEAIRAEISMLRTALPREMASAVRLGGV